jgi:hypothetical protein
MFSHLSRPLLRILFLPLFLNVFVADRMANKDIQVILAGICEYAT